MPIVSQSSTSESVLRFTWDQMVAILAAAEGVTVPDRGEAGDVIGVWHVTITPADPNDPNSVETATRNSGFDTTLPGGMEIVLKDVE